MAEARFDRAQLEAFIRTAADRLHGRWLLVGGAAAALWLTPRRTTEDVDLVGLDDPSQRMQLLELADAAGLPVEAVNSAADFFVRAVPGWDRDLVVLATGPRATIFRPSATLFLLLKVRRLSEVDLADCLAALDHSRATGEPLDADQLAAAIAALPVTTDAALANRRNRLAHALGQLWHEEGER
ncbi:MAG: hypothetical protein AMXMBFR64_41080 [Myxococcales bacterium]